MCNYNCHFVLFYQIGGKFPENRYMVEKHQLVPTVKVNPMDVSPKIRQFCGNFPIFKVEETTLEESEKRAQKYISGNDKLYPFLIFIWEF